MLLELLRKILNISDDVVLYTEAKKKLIDTIMIVNGVPNRVLEFFLKEDKVAIMEANGDIKKVTVKSLKVWLPKTGLYPLSDGRVILVRKVPKKQWYKSYHNSYYDIKPLGKPSVKVKNLDLYNEIYIQKEKEICVDAFGDIYYRDNKIGNILNSQKLLCTDSRYIQELIDWCKAK